MHVHAWIRPLPIILSDTTTNADSSPKGLPCKKCKDLLLVATMRLLPKILQYILANLVDIKMSEGGVKVPRLWCILGKFGGAM